MNAYAEIALAAYIVAVLIAKNEQHLIDMLKLESGFFRWAIALMIVVAFTDELGEAGAIFQTMVFVAMAIVAIEKNPHAFDNLFSIVTGMQPRNPGNVTTYTT